MPHTAPSTEDLKERYAAFAAVDDDVVDYWLDDAMRSVTTDWIEADYAPAIMALAAHNMALQRIGASGAGSVGGLAGVTDFRSGSFSASFALEAVKAQIEGGHGATPYGREFRTYLRRNRAGPRIAGGTLGCRWS